ncbi:hypothetical protein [Bradyrhizobium sp. BR 10289]|uniref:hypothetical protein n=1 Tax=Bradyrhizobium sp. BR 10289 TaxID=2749993 RepID=UPI001C64E507|nr:hypothetical protein [Bradyrhizobium sp. BR 10289]MBW7971181.1 hypothetical protein [Bradyrhizobium sp. BR 10289]
MDKDRRLPRESATERKADMPTGDRVEGAPETGWADHAIKDALEDDEVREALKLHRRGKRP